MHEPARAQRTLSLQEFERLDEEDAWRLELVRGRVVREPRPAPLHGRILARLARLLDEYTDREGAGRVFADTGFVLSEDPPTVRGPDLALVRLERIPAGGYPTGLWRLAPDLAVEIVSPSNTASELQEKVVEYLEAGVRSVWIVDPSTRTVTVYGSRGRARLISGAATVVDREVLPGFELSLEELFRV